MENLKPYMRWAAVGIAAIALAFAYISPHHADTAATSNDSPPPAPASPPQVAASGPLDATAGGSPSPSQLAVYVCGAVVRSGVFRLSPGSRVVDAVERAGGLSKDADGEAINLAQPLLDGMKVCVPRKGARPDPSSDFGASDFGGRDLAVDLHGRPETTSHSSHRRSSSRSGSHKLQPGQTIDINTATESDLIQLPGVGPSLARRIIEYREANGPFATADDLQNVSGIGPSKFARMVDFVRV